MMTKSLSLSLRDEMDGAGGEEMRCGVGMGTEGNSKTKSIQKRGVV